MADRTTQTQQMAPKRVKLRLKNIDVDLNPITHEAEIVDPDEENEEGLYDATNPPSGLDEQDVINERLAMYLEQQRRQMVGESLMNHRNNLGEWVNSVQPTQ